MFTSLFFLSLSLCCLSFFAFVFFCIIIIYFYVMLLLYPKGIFQINLSLFLFLSFRRMQNFQIQLQKSSCEKVLNTISFKCNILD